jgi:phage baseplate assembly protein gpV
MTAIVPALRALIRQELAAARQLELGVITQVSSNEGGAGDSSLEVNLRVRGSAVELQKVPVMVGRRGLSCLPRVGDMVVVGFVGGALNAPVVLGAIYDDQVLPPDAAPDEILYVVPDDAADGKRRLEVQLPDNRTVTIEDAKVVITLGSTKVIVEADGAITLEAGGDINLKAQGAIAIEATGEATLKGSLVTVEGQSSAKLKGSSTTIAGNTNFSPT